MSQRSCQICYFKHFLFFISVRGDQKLSRSPLFRQSRARFDDSVEALQRCQIILLLLSTGKQGRRKNRQSDNGIFADVADAVHTEDEAITTSNS